MSKVIKSSQARPRPIAVYERGVLDDAPAAPAVDDETGEWAEVADPQAVAEAEARQQLEDLFEDCRRRGLEAGRQEFERAAADAVAALANAADAMRRAQDEFFASLEPQVLKLVEAMALRILGREARVDPQVAARTAREALRYLGERERLTLRFNPDDLQAMRRQGVDPFAGVEGLGSVELTADPEVGPGGCVAETESVQVDARLDQQLAKILEALAE